MTDLPPQFPPPLDQPEWDKAAVAAAIDSLKAIRGTAEKWVGTVTALLGVFSSVALVTGVDKVKDVTSTHNLRYVLVGAVIVAGLTAGASILTGSLAAQGVSKVYSNWDGFTLRTAVNAEVPKAKHLLDVSRYLGIAAALLVFAVGVGTLISAARPADAGSPSIVVVNQDGSISCQKISTGKAGVVEHSGKAIQVLVVTGC